eukprot:Hpha_TRINITY_DN25976_c0_g1::TRINITY_DN25976_c0_g1_i1::g.185241::m.185241
MPTETGDMVEGTAGSAAAVGDAKRRRVEVTEEEVRRARVDYLRLWDRLLSGGAGRHAVVHLYEKFSAEGTLVAVDGEQSSMLFRNMKTRAGTLPSAVLRCSDVLRVDLPIEAPGSAPSGEVSATGGQAADADADAPPKN